jgi:GNAT acetyltransferase
MPSRDGGVRVRYLDDIYCHLLQPAPPVRSEAVQRLTLADLPLLEAAPPEMRIGGFGSLAALLTDGIVAGALVDGQIVTIARTSARSEKHGDIAVATLEGWRNHGFATAAASLVTQELQAAGQIPVWSAGAHNAASLRVAEKLRFTEVARRRYVILDADKRAA